MAVNGIGIESSVNAAELYKSNNKPATEAAAAQQAVEETPAAVYEKSDDSAVSSIVNPKTQAVDHEAIIAKMKFDAEQQTAQLRSIVEKLILGQSKSDAIAGADTGANTLMSDEDMWKFLAKGDFTVDAATKAQAQADIAEDGYWGVEKTSDRIIDFAKALAGNDPSKAQDLLDAFKEGYKQAEEMWGGKLPEISAQTYEAVEKKFADWMNVDEV